MRGTSPFMAPEALRGRTHGELSDVYSVMREVERRDVLYLCWSRSARASRYVELEWRHALETKGIDCIEPIPFEPPALCPPPEELRSKHFNDALLYLVRDSTSQS